MREQRGREDGLICQPMKRFEKCLFFLHGVSVKSYMLDKIVKGDVNININTCFCNMSFETPSQVIEHPLKCSRKTFIQFSKSGK